MSSSSSLESSSSSHSSSSSNSENSIPKFPSKRDEYRFYRKIMLAYLDSRGLKQVVLSKAVSSSNSANAKEISETEQQQQQQQSSSSSNTSTNNNNNSNEALSKRAFSILLQSLNIEQQALVLNISDGDAAAVWKKLEDTYGTVKTTESRMSILDQLKYISIHKHETIEHYIARIDHLILELSCMNEETSKAQRKYYILEGLSEMSEWSIPVSIWKWRLRMR